MVQLGSKIQFIGFTWIIQKAMAELFGVQTPAISKHLKNIFAQGELREEVVVSKMEIPTPHGAIPGKTQLSPTNLKNNIPLVFKQEG